MNKQMDASKSVMVSFSLYRYNGRTLDGAYNGFPHPRDIKDPKGVVRTEWIPQTVADSVWKLHEFKTVADRDAFLDDRPDVYVEAIVKIQDRDFYDHWTGLHGSCLSADHPDCQMCVG